MANPDSVQPGDPPWLKTAFKELGEREIAGRKSNPDIERFLQSSISPSWRSGSPSRRTT